MSVIDWSRAGRPQADGYDSRVALHLLATRPLPGSDRLYVRPPGTGHATFCGTISLRRWAVGMACLRNHPDAPFDHPNLERAEAYLARWAEGALKVRALIDAVHPVIDPSSKRGPSTPAVSSSRRDTPGAAALSIDSPYTLAELLLQEAAAQQVWAFARSSDLERLLTRLPRRQQRADSSEAPRIDPAVQIEICARVAHALALACAVLDRPVVAEERIALIPRIGELATILEAKASVLSAIQAESEAERTYLASLGSWVAELRQNVAHAAGIVPVVGVPSLAAP